MRRLRLAGVVLAAGAAGALAAPSYRHGGLARRLEAALRARYGEAVVEVRAVRAGAVSLRGHVLTDEWIHGAARGAAAELERLRDEVLRPAGLREFTADSRLQLMGRRGAESFGAEVDRRRLEPFAADVAGLATGLGVAVKRLQVETHRGGEVSVHLDGDGHGGDLARRFHEGVRGLVRARFPGMRYSAGRSEFHLGGGHHGHDDHDEHGHADHGHDDHDHGGHDHEARPPPAVSASEADAAWDSF